MVEGSFKANALRVIALKLIALFCFAGANANTQPAATNTVPVPGSASKVTESKLVGISLKEAFRSSLEKTEVVPLAKTRMKQVEARQDQAWSRFLPTIVLEGSFQQQDTVGVRSNLFGGRQSFGRFNLSQNLFDGFRDWNSVKALDSELEVQRQSLSLANYELFASVARSYFGILSGEQEVENLKKTIALGEDRLKEIQGRIRIGRVRTTDLSAAQAQLAVLQSQLSLAEGNLQTAKDQFSLLTGLDRNAKLQPRREIPEEPKPAEHYLALMDQRPDIASAKAQSENAKSQITIARAGHYPSLVLSGNYFVLREGTQKGNDWDIGAAVSLPIFNGGLIRAQVSEANIRAEGADLTLMQTRRLAEIAIRTAHNNFVSLMQQLKALDLALKATEKNFTEHEKNYRFGQADNLDVIQALNSFQETKRNFDRTRFLALSAAAELRAATAQVSLAKAPEE